MTGAGGFIGRSLIGRLSARGIATRALVRQPSADELPSIERVVVSDLAHADQEPLLAGCDIVINLAARVHVVRETSADPAAEFHRLNCDLALGLAGAARQTGVRRFVQLSSVAALASVTPPGIVLDDSSQPRPTGAYGRSKLAADDALRDLAGQTGLQVVSLRPPTVYGPGVPAQFGKLMSSARRGLPLPIGGVRNARSMIFIENLVDAILAAAFGDGEGAFVVTDSPPVSTASLYRSLLAAYGRRPWLPAVPRWPLEWAGRALLGDRVDSLLASSAFDGRRFGETFGWRPAIAFEDAIRATVEGTR